MLKVKLSSKVLYILLQNLDCNIRYEKGMFIISLVDMYPNALKRLLGYHVTSKKRISIYNHTGFTPIRYVEIPEAIDWRYGAYCGILERIAVGKPYHFDDREVRLLTNTKGPNFFMFEEVYRIQNIRKLVDYARYHYDICPIII